MRNKGEWSNWSGSVRAAVPLLQPHNEAELADIILRHAAIRAVGAGHSFMPLCETKGALVNLAAMDGGIQLAPNRQSAMIPAGWSIARLTQALWDDGLALANQGDVNPQALAGALATGTHGTGLAFGSLSTMAQGFRLMAADGQVHSCSATENPSLFEAQRLSLGLLGIATHIEMAVVPAFHLAEMIETRPFAEVVKAYAGWSAAHRHAEFWIFPYSDRAIVKRLSLCDPCEAPASSQDIGEGLFRFILNLCAAAPMMTPWLQRLMMASGISGARRGPAWRVFPSDRTVHFEEMEYEVPLENGMAALSALISWIRKHRLPVSFPFEYRTVAADDIWLSPMNRGPVAAISMHQYAKMQWRPLFREAEAILRDHGGRPHWAKRHNLSRADVDIYYPRAEDFRCVRRQMDPDGKFLNSHLQEIFA